MADLFQSPHLPLSLSRATLPRHKSPSWHLHVGWHLWRWAAGAWLADSVLLLYLCFLGPLPVMMEPHGDFGAGPFLLVGGSFVQGLLLSPDYRLSRNSAVVCVSPHYALSFFYSSFPGARPACCLTAFPAFKGISPNTCHAWLFPSCHPHHRGPEQILLCAFASSWGTFCYFSA